MKSDLISKLNNFVETEFNGKNELSGTVTFTGGETVSALNDICKRIAPSGKVLAVYDERSFLEFGPKYTGVINSVQSKPVNIVLQKGDEFEKSTFTELSDLAEDARCFLVFNAEFLGIATKVACTKEIPVIFFMKSFSEYDILPVEFGTNVDNFQNVKITGAERIINVDISAVENSGKRYLPYISAVKHIPSFSDYRIACESNIGIANQYAYDIARSAVLEIYGVYKVPKKEQFGLLIYNYFKLGLANILSGGDLFENSAVKCAEKLLYIKGYDFNSYEISRIITGIYAIGFSGEYEGVGDTADYVDRVNRLANYTGVDEGLFLTSMREQISSFRSEENTSSGVYAKIKDELLAQSKLFGKIKSTYISLGGSVKCDKNKTLYAVKHSGDLPNSFNGMTVLREKGILESL